MSLKELVQIWRREEQQSFTGWRAMEETQNALVDSGLLRTCNWQAITEKLRESALLPWLTEQLQVKYGL